MNKQILMIDCENSLQHFAVESLTSAGYLVLDKRDCNYSFDGLEYIARKPNLVIFTCSMITDFVEHMLKQLAQEDMSTFVLCKTLPLEAMRLAFLAGAMDVTEMPHTPQSFIQEVDRVFEKVSMRERLSYARREIENV